MNPLLIKMMNITKINIWQRVLITFMIHIITIRLSCLLIGIITQLYHHLLQFLECFGVQLWCAHLFGAVRISFTVCYMTKDSLLLVYPGLVLSLQDWYTKSICFSHKHLTWIDTPFMIVSSVRSEKEATMFTSLSDQSISSF